MDELSGVGCATEAATIAAQLFLAGGDRALQVSVKYWDKGVLDSGSQVQEPQPPADAGGNTVSSAAFLELVNQVLTDAGRGTLPKGSPQEKIITVYPTDRVLQILAGPGSGKTETLVWRALYELFVLGESSQRVLVTTFTRRAATELQVRVVERSDALLAIAAKQGIAVSDPKVHDLRIGTIHSLCDSLLAEFDTDHVEAGTQLVDETEINVRIARDHRLALGYNPPGRPPRVLNRLLENPALAMLFRPAWDDSANWPGSMMERATCISSILNQHIETWIPRCSSTKRPNGIELVHGPAGVLTEDLVKLQSRWEEYLSRNTILDFPTVQKRFLERQHLALPHISHVFVDEFQDNNPIQFAIHTAWLRAPQTRLTVVGDDDQAIYRFRGSDIECFNQLHPSCTAAKVACRIERLETNYRSTKRIITFGQRFRTQSALDAHSMTKHITWGPKAPVGEPVRLLEGEWTKIAKCVADELKSLGAGSVPKDGSAPPSAAVLMFSTSERSSRDWASPAIIMRDALEAAGIRVYNPRNKTAAQPESPVSQLLGLISLLIDPISYEPAGRNGRTVMVAASMSDSGKQAFAQSAPPPFRINQAHLEFQKKFLKMDGGDIGAPHPNRAPLVEFVSSIRAQIAKACSVGRRPRLTLAGFVSRLLAHPYFRNCGFSPALFRQALFTELVEANIAPTRLTRRSLDQPLEVHLTNKKYHWDDRYWQLLNVFGAYLKDAPIDDPEVESFQEGAVLMLTFHQTKGLEFDHVYVAGTGRTPDIGPALRTRLFSGDSPQYRVDNGLKTRDKQVAALALADRDREVYVAITRAKKTLTLLCDPKADLYMSLNPTIARLFKSSIRQPHPVDTNVSVLEFHND